MPAFCKDCQHEIDEVLEAAQGRQPCSRCGSLSRRYDESLTSSLAAGAMMHTKGYAPGVSRRKGLRFESKDGDSFSTSLGRFVKLNQLADHEKDRYVKRVVDPKTGQVLRDVDEPLSEHTGRGDAKPRKP